MLLALLSAGLQARAEDSLWNAVVKGQFNLNLRYRFEHVDDEFRPGGMPLKDANASTLRTALAYRTGDFYGFSTLLEMEQVSRVFGGDFNEGLGNPGRNATVVDPDGTELNQGYLQYQGAYANQLRVGRQIITYRDAPFHRFIGTVLWRQNWQTFDAVSLTNNYLPNTHINYAYVWNVNRIFGTSAPEPLSSFDSNSHFINIQNNRFSWAQAEAYAYLLDFDNAERFSSQTYGLRVQGEYPLLAWLAPIYTIEYAHQWDYSDNPTDYDAGYHLLEAGFKLKPQRYIDSIMVKFSFERLAADGKPNGSFVTILGTNHAFQGTADRFLVTPDDGIRDHYLSTVINSYGFKFNLSYHVIRSDDLDYRFGEELDMELTRNFGKHLMLGLKYADYDADGNATNRLRNGAEAADVTKTWIYTVIRF